MSDANKNTEFREGYCDIRISRNSPSAFRADVLRGSSRVPGTREEPLRTSAWEATPEVIAKVDSVQSPL